MNHPSSKTARESVANPSSPSAAVAGPGGVRRRKIATTLPAHGQPLIWLTGGMLGLAMAMILGLLTLVLFRGTATFWPAPVVELKTVQGATVMGEITRDSTYEPRPELIEALPAEAIPAAKDLLERSDGISHRWLVRTGNFELSGEHFNWVSDFTVAERSNPPWALVFERQEWGRFYGLPKAFLLDGETIATSPEEVWAAFSAHHDSVRRRWEERRQLEIHAIGKVNHTLEQERLNLRQAKLDLDLVRRQDGADSPRYLQAAAAFEQKQKAVAAAEEGAQQEYARIRDDIAKLNNENARYQLVVSTAQGDEKSLHLADIVRAYPANQLGLWGKLKLYVDRWLEFLSADPREANSEGGVFPAIFGTFVMTMIMSVMVVPFGVLAALYLREYAKAGPLVSTVRIAINNLAGVPSIVFGVFGLGFFCYLMGGTIDQIFFQAKLPSPTFGTGGILWASLTLALLTLPVVIVATEEALAAVPSSMREGSYACGASKWQTIQRIVLPRAMPGIMTGMILAMARGAGEVAPLMLVGAVKLAPELPIDGLFPYVHMERSFMHLGFHIYDLGFQSQNSEAAVPMVYTTTLLLIGLIAVLNMTAIWLRGRLRKKFIVSKF